MAKKSKTNNKRKAYQRTDTESNDDEENEKIDQDLSKLNFDELEPINKIKSPNSKKRYVYSSSDNDSQMPDSNNCDLVQDFSENLSSDMYETEENIGAYDYDTQSYNRMGNEIRKMNGNFNLK